MWRSGQIVDFGNATRVYDHEEYNSGGKEEIENEKTFNKVIYYVNIKPTNKVGQDKNNDCLYNALNTILKTENPFKNPSELKRFFNVNLSDMVDLNDNNILKLEEKLKLTKIGLNIIGDIMHSSPHNFNKNVFLKVANNHISINHKVNYKHEFISYKERKIILVDKKNKLAYHPDFGTFNMSDEFYLDIIKFKTDYIIVKNGLKIPSKEDKKKLIKTNLKDEYDYYINEIVEPLKRETNGKINMYKTGSIKDTALFLLDEETKKYKPDDLEIDESLWIQEATTGALIFNEPYEGYAYKFDVISKYPSTITSNNFLVPLKRGEFKIIDKETFENLKFYSYGIYRCIIEPSKNKNIDRLFRFNDFNKYTNNDLNSAKELGLKNNIDRR
jgi:hypothetical protein